MFIVIPLAILFSALLILALIIFRKRVLLNKLYLLHSSGESDANIAGGAGFTWRGYFSDFFPELVELFNDPKIHEYKSLWLADTEKMLRKTRLLFLRIERLADSMIKRVRRVQSNAQLVAKSAVMEENKSSEHHQAVETAVNVHPEPGVSTVFLKNEEERLIMDIAKNPKDGKLYETLGDLYVEMADFADAKEAYEAAIELNPKEELLKQKLSSALEKLVAR